MSGVREASILAVDFRGHGWRVRFCPPSRAASMVRRVRPGATSGDVTRLVWLFVRVFEHIVSFCYCWPVEGVRTVFALTSFPVNDFQGLKRAWHHPCFDVKGRCTPVRG